MYQLNTKHHSMNIVTILDMSIAEINCLAWEIKSEDNTFNNVKIKFEGRKVDDISVIDLLEQIFKWYNLKSHNEYIHEDVAQYIVLRHNNKHGITNIYDPDPDELREIILETM